MKGVLIEKSYKYDKVVLPVSGVETSGIVYIRDEKIYRTETIQCRLKVGEETKNFSFTLQQPNAGGVRPTEEQPVAWDEPSLNISAWPAGVSVNDTIEEFRTFVLADIA